MIKIYHVPMTRGTRVIWLCEELGLPYEVERIDFSAEYRATPEWRARNPTGKVPVMEDGDVTMFESCAMMDFLLARYGEGRLQPAAGTAEHAPYLQWHWFAEATFAHPLGEIVNHRREFPGDRKKPEMIREMADRAMVCMETVAAHMTDRAYLLGDRFSAADISMGYSLLLAQNLSPDGMLDSLQPYWTTLSARPGLTAALDA